ncbi:MAG: glycosyltransferase family 9 protein [bacterium]|nr:glycosyltransferase family 9 protein [bacterium]
MLRSWLLFIFGARVNKAGSENRWLIVHLEGLGDVVMLTSVLKHYKKDFPDKKIYFLVNGFKGLNTSVFAPMVDELITVDHGRLAKNPWYGMKFVNQLRMIGFERVVSHDPGISELSGKLVALSVGAKETIGYEGTYIQKRLPLDINMALSVRYAEKNLFPRFNKIIPSFDKNIDLKKRIPNNIKHYISVYEAVTGKTHDDYSITLPVIPEAEEKVSAILLDGGIVPGTYCFLNLATSTPHKEWKAEHFAEALLAIRQFKIPIVVGGGKRDAELVARFRKVYGNDLLDVTGKTGVGEYFALVRNSLFSLCNDTATTHIAIAYKKPVITILGLAHFATCSLYGYKDINRWAYARNMDCLCDNWRCMFTVGPDEPTPCIAAIQVPEVVRELTSLIEYLKAMPNYPREPFRVEINE